MSTHPQVTLSVVSHGQSDLIRLLLDDLRKLTQMNFEVVITINIPEDESAYHDLPFPSKIIRNTAPKGFGANHNGAFEQSYGQFFVVVNPDIRLPSLDISKLLDLMRDRKVGAVVPVVMNSAGVIEDSVRRFPTVLDLARRVLLGIRVPSYNFDIMPMDVNWAAGMFIVFRRESYQAVGGFDHKRYFMYLEDVDICLRLKEKGWSVVLQPAVTVVHDAQRASRRSFKHMRWHITSACRYFTGL
jgi:GT2 family glycosyltransferase